MDSAVPKNKHKKGNGIVLSIYNNQDTGFVNRLTSLHIPHLYKVGNIAKAKPIWTTYKFPVRSVIIHVSRLLELNTYTRYDIGEFCIWLLQRGFCGRIIIVTLATTNISFINLSSFLHSRSK